MNEIRLLTTDFFSHHFVEPICARLLANDPEFKFSILAATIDREPDVDIYFLPYEHKFDDFIHETLVESKLYLWASSKYLEKNGVPTNLNDLLSHNVIRPERGSVAFVFGVKRFKTAGYYAPYYYRKDCIKVDGLLSVVNLAENGVGIISSTHFTVSKLGLKLEKIPQIEGDEGCYRSFVVGYHQKHKDNPRLQSIVKALRSAISDKDA